MNRKLSPTPWIIKGNAIFDTNGEVIADVYGDQGERTANGYLFAAAPDLLTELRMLLLVTKCPCASTEDYSHDLYWARRCHRCAKAKEAIAKAEGE